ncbi:MAG: alpha/beta hydrolase [Asgard group archaeon]|nr:alpha/beta hydrolase [Asgard group archaeon]
MLLANTNENTLADNFVLNYKRDVPNFFDENQSEIIEVPVEDGYIRVFHHKPKEVKAKKPIIFLPGFGTAAYSWREFHHTHHNIAEYYHIETRDKKSAQIKRHIKVDFTIDRITHDIADVIKYIDCNNKDYILMGACLCGGVLLYGLIHDILNPPTVIAFDPFTKWTQYRLFVKILMPIFPPVLLDSMKFVIGKAVMKGMENEVQRKRNMENLEEAVGWKWRKFSLQNINYDLTNDFQKIKQEVFIFHGPKDKFHPDGTFQNVAAQIPNGRFFQLNISKEYRELLAGAIATEFSMVDKNNGVPKSLQKYEVPLRD